VRSVARRTSGRTPPRPQAPVALDESSRMNGLDPAGEHGEYHSMVLGGPGWHSAPDVKGRTLSAPPRHPSSSHTSERARCNAAQLGFVCVGLRVWHCRSDMPRALQSRDQGPETDVLSCAHSMNSSIVPKLSSFGVGALWLGASTHHRSQ
jgi:hypothetical protein